ncbi:EAL domain-containing protein [Paraburkholderia rhizosphaerae]|uniref:PAS domain S-box-containing protein/diguanylate cyclase (GGDEF)-like protein n=1 Tax=Paraburkholderia rhizosphaerae TaxID=480658 RepID=A0A4R8LUZ7_9BURK|nr:EAL domain-containing protein [Paraburkholderia rhizosphaerae]TDY51620.1 PAS domain S-box-containing protein/diguanylate cyclase (GGDEF)-like protein [Paraburkholderia rhizosphaerae]
MKRNLFFRLLARLRVGRKLLLIYLLDLSAVLYISGILIHEKYIAIDFSNKEIVGNAYLRTVRDALVKVASVGAGARPPAQALHDTVVALDDAQVQFGAAMQTDALNRRVRDALTMLSRDKTPNAADVNDALLASRELVTRIGNQSNLILDPDLDSYYSMSLSILRYPALLDAMNQIGSGLHDDRQPVSADLMRTRYLVREGQLDAVLQGLRTDFAEAVAANHELESALGPSIGQISRSVEQYRSTARAIVNSGGADAARLAALDAAQQRVIADVGQTWHQTGIELDHLLHQRVRALYARMWLHLGTALFLLFGILTMVYTVAQQISRPLRQLARVMDTVRRTGDHSLRARWHSQDEIGVLVNGFNEMLEQLDRERDVQKELAATARASAAQHALVEATPVPMVVTAVPGHEVLHANRPALVWLNGCAIDPWARGLDSGTRARFFQQLSDREAVDEFEVHWKATDESTWAMLSARRLSFQGQDAILTAFTPINQIKLMEQRLELWARVFEASSESILILDDACRLLTANAAFYKTTGYRSDDVVGRLPGFIVDGLPGDGGFAMLARRVERSSTWNGEAQVRRRQGGDYPAWLMVSVVRDTEGQVTHYICTLIDISDRKKSEARIQFLAEHDFLTELPNRALYKKRLAVALDTAKRTGRRVAVLFIDLDRFKDINDSLGHHIGDGLLRSVATRLVRSVRHDDTVSRLGGDEFTVILNHAQSAADVAQTIEERMIPLIGETHDVNGIAMQVSCSVGIAMYPEDGHDIDTLMQNADLAMYQAKAAGRNLAKFFSPDMIEHSRMRLALEACLRTAIERNELWLAYQPCIDTKSGDVIAVEALLRWDSAELGRMSPAQFIPLAEETRLIVPIGAWVIDEACRQLASWRDGPLDGLTLSINLSAVQLRDDTLVDTLKASLAKHGVAPERLELEITESVLLDGAQHNIATIGEIRALGVRISLDDFGTGYSSLSYLNRFPLDRLKIDRTFVHNKLDKPTDLAIVEAIAGLGHMLGLRVVAEGVENEREANLLRSIGCDELQGFWIARPLSSAQLDDWMRERRTERSPGVVEA